MFNERQLISCVLSEDSNLVDKTVLFTVNTTKSILSTVIPALADAETIQSMLSSLPGVRNVLVTPMPGFTDQLCSSFTGGQFMVEFTYLRGDVPLLTLTPTTDFLHVTLQVAEVQPGTMSFGECSNRGICSTVTG